MLFALMFIAGLSVLSLACVYYFVTHDGSDGRTDGNRQRVRVFVRGGYEPDTIYAVAGRPLELTFRREDTLACSERVVFPGFGKSAMLPPNEDVTIELVPEQPGEYEFSCEAGMLRGRLIVAAPAPEVRSAA